MTPCPSCQAAASDPLTGLYNAGCEECHIRSVASSPTFGQVMAMQRMTLEWMQWLERVAGSEKADREALHQRVKAAYLRRLQG